MLAVAVALRPADYDFGAEAPDGSAWEPYPDADDSFPAAGRFETNPKHMLDDSDLSMLSCWMLYQKGHLPETGGVMDQPALMLDALAEMDLAASKLPKRGGRRG